MMYSTTCSYAIRALCRLTMISPNGYARMQEICEGEGEDMPAHFLAKIFRDLARVGLLRSAKGRGGGFALARRPSEITLYDIVQAVDGTDRFTQCVVGLSKCDSDQPCPQHEAFKPVRKEILSYLESTTLEQMSGALSRKIELISSPQTILIKGKTQGD